MVGTFGALANSAFLGNLAGTIESLFTMTSSRYSALPTATATRFCGSNTMMTRILPRLTTLAAEEYNTAIPTGALTQVTDPAGAVNTYAYDDGIKMTQKTEDPYGQAVVYDYNSDNLPVRMADQQGDRKPPMTTKAACWNPKTARPMSSCAPMTTIR